MNNDLKDILSQRRYDAYITAVYLNGVSQSSAVRGRAMDITYDAAVVTQKGVARVQGVRPYNSMYEKASVISARVEDYCDIVVDLKKGTSRLYVHTEREDLRDCNGAPIESLP